MQEAKVKPFFQECENRRVQENTSEHPRRGAVIRAGREGLFAVSETAAAHAVHRFRRLHRLKRGRARDRARGATWSCRTQLSNDMARVQRGAGSAYSHFSLSNL